jgi:hypothetical protein
VDFALGGVIVPDNLIFTVSVVQMLPDVGVGLATFSPPTVGSSDSAGHLRRRVQLGQINRYVGRAGTLVGTRHGLGLPRVHLRPFVMNRMVPSVISASAAALVERLYNIVKR